MNCTYSCAGREKESGKSWHFREGILDWWLERLIYLIVQFLFQELAEREDILKFWKVCQKKIPSWVTYEIWSTKLSRDLHACVLTVSRDLAISLSFAFRWRTTLRKFSFNFLAGMNGEAIQHTALLQKVRMILERRWFWFILRLFLCCLTIFHRTS